MTEKRHAIEHKIYLIYVIDVLQSSWA